MKQDEDYDIILVLKEKSIHITQPRIQVLKIIFNLSQSTFSLKTFLTVNDSMNRISVYRALQLFVKHKIIRKVPNTKGILEYTLYSEFDKQLRLKDTSNL